MNTTTRPPEAKTIATTTRGETAYSLLRMPHGGLELWIMGGEGCSVGGVMHGEGIEAAADAAEEEMYYLRAEWSQLVSDR